MILDEQAQFSDAQALSVTGGLATNVVDLSVARDMGAGTPLAVVFNIDVAADQTTGDEDYTFQVEVASDAAQTADVTPLNEVTFESGTPGVGARNADLLVAGYQFALPVPSIGGDNAQRYLGVRYTLAGTTPTVTVTAHLIPLANLDTASMTSYADNVTIT